MVHVWPVFSFRPPPGFWNGRCPNCVGAVVVDFKDACLSGGGPQLTEVQQYSAVWKTVQGLLQPPGARSSSGHSSFMSAVHQMTSVQALDGRLSSIGTLNPSTREISRKSRLYIDWFNAYSTVVTGGAPDVVH
ncbi:hypothetical protein ACH5RR_038468 [Cinchona calisaya]|uniref:Uncharacterized protein n=1 Tax=Cinchona calisaya TaxID=153742 RepID=A0ABD2Y0U0_9GENT